MEGSDSESAKFTVPTLKAFLKAHSQNVSGNKQTIIARAIGCHKMQFFHALVIIWSAEKCILYHLSPVIFANVAVVAAVVASQF